MLMLLYLYEATIIASLHVLDLSHFRVNPVFDWSRLAMSSAICHTTLVTEKIASSEL